MTLHEQDRPEDEQANTSNLEPLSEISESKELEPSAPLSEAKKDKSEELITQESEKKPKHKERYELFLEQIETLEALDEKLSETISFMEEALSTKQGTPYFKSFWDARTLAQNFFRENINPTLRLDLWGRYSELSKEARRLKQLLDEQSAFAAEQIDIAITALEKEIESNEEMISKRPPLEFLLACNALTAKTYDTLQQELNFLNAHAGRITALRKELIRTEMRIRQKNQFFERLSSAGDKVFPRRKELIKEISSAFNKDIDLFLKKHFSSDTIEESSFFLREEIKALQNTAKRMTLNTQTFSSTRVKLSDAWDKLKLHEKERKKERGQKRAESKLQEEEYLNQLSQIRSEIESGKIRSGEALQQVENFSRQLAQAGLERSDVIHIREEIEAVRKPILEKQKSEELERQQLQDEKELQRKEKITQQQNEIEDVLQSVESLDCESLEADLLKLQQKVALLNASKPERQGLERQLKTLKDAILIKRADTLHHLSKDDQQAIQQLQGILAPLKKEKQEIKASLDQLRKLAGASGLGFEQAMDFNHQITEEKERLDKVIQGIKSIESKLADWR